MAIAELLSNVLSGGVTGLIGAGITRLAEYKTKKLEFEHEGHMKELDLKIMAEEWAHRTQIASVEADAKIEAGDIEAFKASFNEPELYSGKVATLTRWQSWVLVLLDFVRGVVRPGLTLYLCLITTYLYWDAHSIIPGMGVDAATQLVGQIVNTVLYLTSVVICWWFGTRIKEKK